MALIAQRTVSLKATGGEIDHNISKSLSYTNGTADNQINVSQPYTLVVNNTSLTIDLSATGLAFTKVREIVVFNANTATGEYVDVGGGTNDLAGMGTMRVHPSGILHWAAPVDGVAVVATTGDTITFDTTGSTANVTVHVLVVGTK